MLCLSSPPRPPSLRQLGYVFQQQNMVPAPPPGSGGSGSGKAPVGAEEDVPEADVFGACRPVSSYEKLNLIGEVREKEEGKGDRSRLMMMMMMTITLGVLLLPLEGVVVQV